MAEPFIGEIKMWALNFAPLNWAKCDGAIINISQNTALFALLGTAFGGNGTTTFALPDMRGRMPVGEGTYVEMGTVIAYDRGDVGGSESVTLTESELPAHTHPLYAADELGDKTGVGGQANRVFADAGGVAVYGSPANLIAMKPATTSVGSGQSHYNMQPSTVVNFCISLKGIFPPRN